MTRWTGDAPPGTASGRPHQSVNEFAPSVEPSSSQGSAPIRRKKHTRAHPHGRTEKKVPMAGTRFGQIQTDWDIKWTVLIKWA